MYADPLATAAEWRARAEARNLSIRELMIEVTGRQTFVGTPTAVADAVDDFVQSRGGRRASSSSPTSPPPASTTSSTGSSRCCRSAARCATTTRRGTLRGHLGLPPTAPSPRTAVEAYRSASA